MMPTETLRPNAAGDKTEWPTQYPDTGVHWDKVDEETSDGDSTYIEILLNIIGAKIDLFNIPNTSIPSDSTINSVTVYVRHRGTLAPYTRARPWMKTGGVEYAGGTRQSSGTTYVLSSYTWTTNPQTGLPWTLDEINALQIGVEGIRGRFYDPDLGYFYYDDTRCTQVYMEIAYTLVAVRKVVGDGLTCVVA